jgi:hypothetical protein
MCPGLQRISFLWVEEEEVHRKAQNASWKTELQRWCSVMHRHRDTERSLGASVFISPPYLFQMLWLSTSVGAFCVFCFTQALYCEYIIVFTRSSNSKLKYSSSITQVMRNEQAGSLIWAAFLICHCWVSQVSSIVLIFTVRCLRWAALSSYVTVGCLRWAALFSYLLMSVSGDQRCSHMSLLGVSGEQHCSHIHCRVSQVSSIVLICHCWVSQVSSLFSFVTVGCLSWATLFLYVTVGCVSVYQHCSYMNQLSGFDLIRLWDCGVFGLWNLVKKANYSDQDQKQFVHVMIKAAAFRYTCLSSQEASS